MPPELRGVRLKNELPLLRELAKSSRLPEAISDHRTVGTARIAVCAQCRLACCKALQPFCFVGLTLIGKQTFSDLVRRAFPDASKSDDNYTENLTDKVSVNCECRKNCSAILFCRLDLDRQADVF